MNERVKLLTIALCCGDALGATSEFERQEDVPVVFSRYGDSGWPFKQSGGGAFNWSVGDYTDDGQMAVAMVHAIESKGRFDPEAIAVEWVKWLDAKPVDIGNSTRQGLNAVKWGTPWYEGGLVNFLHSHAAANGSLMRNAPIAGYAETNEQAFEYSLKQSLATHFGPLAVICCCAQSYLIRRLFDRRSLNGWRFEFKHAFTEWMNDTQGRGEDLVVCTWSTKVAEALNVAWEEFMSADFDPDSFTPFGYQFGWKDGWCLLTLQIAVWAAHWSIRNAPFPTPLGFPDEVFKKAVGSRFGAVVAMIGHDSDTYAAAAFPLIAAWHNEVPSEMLEGLRIAPDLK